MNIRMQEEVSYIHAKQAQCWVKEDVQIGKERRGTIGYPAKKDGGKTTSEDNLRTRTSKVHNQLQFSCKKQSTAKRKQWSTNADNKNEGKKTGSEAVQSDHLYRKTERRDEKEKVSQEHQEEKDSIMPGGRKAKDKSGMCKSWIGQAIHKNCSVVRR